MTLTEQIAHLAIGGTNTRDLCVALNRKPNIIRKLAKDAAKKFGLIEVLYRGYDKALYLFADKQTAEAHAFKVQTQLMPAHREEMRRREVARDRRRYKKTIPTMMNEQWMAMKRFVKSSHGVTSDDFAAAFGLDQNSAYKRLRRLEQADEAFSHRNFKARVWYGSRAERDAAQGVEPKKAPKLFKIGEVVRSMANKPGAQMPTVQVANKPALTGDIVIPAGVRIEKLPGWTHNHRYQVGPREHVPSIFRSIPYGSL